MGTQVAIVGTGFIQATGVTVGGIQVTAFTVNSDKLVTITVPVKAKTGKIVIVTPGGKATSTMTYTVT